MVSLGLLRCEKIFEQLPTKTSFYERLKKRLKQWGKQWFTHNKDKAAKINKIESIEVDNNLRISIVELPLLREKMEVLDTGVINKLLNFHKDQSIDFLGLPAWVKYEKSKKIIQANEYSNMIFTCMIKRVIDMIFVKKRLALNSIDIVLICTDLTVEIKDIINEIIPYIKFLTIIAHKSIELMKYVENVFDETGLCISLSTEHKRIINGAGLILNFDNTGILRKYLGANKKMPILNLSTSNLKIESENPVINGILLGLPVSIKEELTDKVGDLYEKDELAKILVIAYAKAMDDENTKYNEVEISSDKVIKAISNLDISIVGFEGIRGNIQA